MKFKTAILGICAMMLCFTLGGCKWWGNDDDTKKPAATGYEITVYQDGKAAQKVDAVSYAAENDTVSYVQSAKDRDGKNLTGSANGTWSVKHNAWKATASDKRYQATLYSGKVAVGSWTVRSFSTDSQSVLLYPSDGTEVMRVCGNVVIRELKSGEKAPATSRVSVSTGNDQVVTLELSSYQVIGKHLQGTAADGSGDVFIWGNFKVENLK